MRGVWSRAVSGGAESPRIYLRYICQKHDPFFEHVKRTHIIYIYVVISPRGPVEGLDRGTRCNRP